MRFIDCCLSFTDEIFFSLLKDSYTQLQSIVDGIAQELDMVATLFLAGPAPDCGGQVKLV